jgi:signal transduction histidine kinase
VLTRRFALKLLAPIVLVSLALVGGCIFGLLYLNALHVEASEVLSENLRSTLVALQLERDTRSLVYLLKGSERDLSNKVMLRYQDILQLRDDAQELANWDEEKRLVKQIEQGLATFNDEREKLMGGNQAKSILPDDRTRHHLAALLETGVLPSSIELQKFNSVQIRESDRRNRAIVNTLKWGLIALGLGIPITGLILGFAMARSMGRSIYQLSVGIRDAAGRLNRELGSVTLEEKGDLPDLHRQMQGVLVEIERVIGQLQQREREVLRAEQLAAVGQVAAGVAHELRNPLTSVKMLIQTGLEGSPPQSLPAEDLTIIENEIRRMEQCIRVLLDFARPPSPERRPVNLADILRRAVTLVEGRARRQEVTLALDLPHEPIGVNIDPEQIHQVLINLLLNALDALPKGGTVQVAVNPGQRPVDSQDKDELAASSNGAIGSFRSPVPGAALPTSFVEVRIRDTGPGIVPRVRQRLFEPFVTSKETGLGLGLSICKRLIEDHGGAIRGNNCAEGGAEFIFSLPR